MRANRLPNRTRNSIGRNFAARRSQPVLFARCHSSNTFSMWARRCPCCCLLGVCISSLQPPRCKQIGHPQNSPKCIGLRPPLRSKCSSCVLAKRPSHLRRIRDPTRVPKSLAPSTRSKRRRWRAGACQLTAPSPTSRNGHFSFVGDSRDRWSGISVSADYCSVASAAWIRWPWSSVIRLESTFPK